MMKPLRFSRRCVQGQAMVWFLALVTACAAVLYGVYNVGQVTSAKQKVVNATDAGALAGATQQARLLNFMAYGNRAMIATDVLTAQMVSLDSWLRYLRTTSQNVGLVSNAIPVAGQVISRILQTVSNAVEEVEEIYGGEVMPLAVTTFNLLKRVVEGANEVAYQTGGPVANLAASNVVSANRTVFGTPARTDQAPELPNLAVAGLVLGANEAAWRGFSTLYDGSERGRTREVVIASLDDFTRERNGNFITNVSAVVARLEKRGGTRLIEFDRWEAQDTLDLRTRPFSRWLRTTVPIGWGRADVGGSGNLEWGGTTAQRLAFDDRRDIADRAPNQWSGISSVRDLSESVRTADTPPTLSFLLVTAKPRAATPTSTQLGMAPQPASAPWGSAHMGERLLADRVSAVSAGRVYFERPQRGVGDWTADAWAGRATLFREDRAKEFASLYNPFWQASLAPVSPTQRAAVLTAMGAPTLAADALLDVLP